MELRTSHLYLIPDRRVGLFKVGKSDDPAARILRTALRPGEEDFAGSVVIAAPVATVFALERHMHRLLAEHHAPGKGGSGATELYRISGWDLAMQLVDLIASAGSGGLVLKRGLAGRQRRPSESQAVQASEQELLHQEALELMAQEYMFRRTRAELARTMTEVRHLVRLLERRRKMLDYDFQTEKSGRCLVVRGRRPFRRSNQRFLEIRFPYGMNYRRLSTIRFGDKGADELRVSLSEGGLWWDSLAKLGIDASAERAELSSLLARIPARGGHGSGPSSSLPKLA